MQLRGLTAHTGRSDTAVHHGVDAVVPNLLAVRRLGQPRAVGGHVDEADVRTSRESSTLTALKTLVFTPNPTSASHSRTKSSNVALL